MAGQDKVLKFLQTCSRAMAEQAHLPQEVEGASVLTQRVAMSTPLVFEPSWLQALDSIEVTGLEDTILAQSFLEVSSLLRWIPSLRAKDGGSDFALAPLNDVRDFGDVMVGVMYIRAGTQYPLHCHKPQELYLTISGKADWRFGGHEDYRPVGSGEVLYNNPNDCHSAAAGAAPVVALYMQWP